MLGASLIVEASGMSHMIRYSSWSFVGPHRSERPRYAPCKVPPYWPMDSLGVMTRGFCGIRWSTGGSLPCFTRSASWGASLYLPLAVVVAPAVGAAVAAAAAVVGAAVGAAFWTLMGATVGAGAVVAAAAAGAVVAWAAGA